MTQKIVDISSILKDAEKFKVRGKKARDLYAYLGGITSEWEALTEDPSQKARDRQAELWRMIAKVKHFPMCMDMCEYSIGQSVGLMSHFPDGHYVNCDYEWEVIQDNLEVHENPSDTDDEIPF